MKKLIFYSFAIEHINKSQFDITIIDDMSHERTLSSQRFFTNEAINPRILDHFLKTVINKSNSLSSIVS